MTPPNAASPTLAHLAVDTVVVGYGPAPSITVGGVARGTKPASVGLFGARQCLDSVVTVDGERWQAVIPLLTSHWGSEPLPPRSGRYELRAETADGLPFGIEAGGDLPAGQLIEGVTRMRFDGQADALVVTFAAPLTDRERGPLQQAAREADYRATDYTPLNAVFFESFYGQNASCNPLAIDRALARLRPDVLRYWSVADASVRVPEGAVAIIEGSEEWWRIRGSARLLVVNDWLRKRFRKRPHQTVLQTWHGTMLKKLALNRLRLGIRPALATLRERGNWDILLAQNPHSRRVFRSAYAFRGQVWEEGYPRDDVLLTGDAAEVRARLGIPQGVTVLLYAPTWRDDRPEQIDHLDVARFAEAMGDGYVTLIRGHSRTLLPGADVQARNVIDVTGYPDVSELFLVADALITDYSSVMFDFSVTGKPIYFFTPDLDHYREKLRGFYFDLIEVAPGPVVRTLDELVSLIPSPDATRSRYAERYAAWRERFNPRDDGGAAERVVRRLLAAGMLPEA